jgi:hypothetical protein
MTRGDGGKFDSYYYDSENHLSFNPLAGYAHEHQVNSNEDVEQMYYGIDGSLLSGPAGYAVHITKINPAEHTEVEQFLDQNQKPVYGPQGYSERHSRSVGDGTSGARDPVPLHFRN